MDLQKIFTSVVLSSAMFTSSALAGEQQNLHAGNQYLNSSRDVIQTPQNQGKKFSPYNNLATDSRGSDLKTKQEGPKENPLTIQGNLVSVPLRR